MVLPRHAVRHRARGVRRIVPQSIAHAARRKSVDLQDLPLKDVVPRGDGQRVRVLVAVGMVRRRRARVQQALEHLVRALVAGAVRSEHPRVRLHDDSLGQAQGLDGGDHQRVGEDPVRGATELPAVVGAVLAGLGGLAADLEARVQGEDGLGDAALVEGGPDDAEAARDEGPGVRGLVVAFGSEVGEEEGFGGLSEGDGFETQGGEEGGFCFGDEVSDDGACCGDFFGSEEGERVGTGLCCGGDGGGGGGDGRHFDCMSGTPDLETP